jgi:hypothetical protein
LENNIGITHLKESLEYKAEIKEKYFIFKYKNENIQK